VRLFWKVWKSENEEMREKERMGGNTLAYIASNSRKGARYANQGTDDLMEFSDPKKKGRIIHSGEQVATSQDDTLR